MTPNESFERLQEHMKDVATRPYEAVVMSREIVIVCADCDRKNVAYRNRCSKCGSAHWVPAGKVKVN